MTTTVNHRSPGNHESGLVYVRLMRQVPSEAQGRVRNPAT